MCTYRNTRSLRRMSMKAEERIDRILREHEIRLSKLESLLTKRSKPKGKLQDINPAPTRLTDHILAIRDSKYFAQPRTVDETHKKLQGSYHCEMDRVSMALLRLAKRKQLRRATKSNGDKKYQAYVW